MCFGHRFDVGQEGEDDAHVLDRNGCMDGTTVHIEHEVMVRDCFVLYVDGA